MDNDLVGALWSVLTNPNAVYILLIVGLRSAVAAPHVRRAALTVGAAVAWVLGRRRRTTSSGREAG